MSLAAFRHLDRIGGEIKPILEANRKLLMNFFDSRDDLEVVRPQNGTIAFPKLKKGDAKRLLELLRKDFETSVVPGSFFEMSQHFRVGIGVATNDVRMGLQQLERALDHLASRG